MCECMTRVNDSLKDRNTRLQTSFILTRDLSGMDCTPLLAVEKRDSAKRGRPMSVIPTFCPFCGVKYPRKGEEGGGLPLELADAQPTDECRTPRNQMMLPIARTEPSCFSDVDGFPMSQRGAHAAQGDGSAKIGVGDGAASCELKASFASSGAIYARRLVARHVRSRNVVRSIIDFGAARIEVPSARDVRRLGSIPGPRSTTFQ